MKIIEKLGDIWSGIDYPFLIHKGDELRFSDITNQSQVDFSEISRGDVVAIIGDFNPSSIFNFLKLIDLGVIVVPLTVDTMHQHNYFYESSLVNVVRLDFIWCDTMIIAKN